MFKVSKQLYQSAKHDRITDNLQAAPLPSSWPNIELKEIIHTKDKIIPNGQILGFEMSK